MSILSLSIALLVLVVAVIISFVLAIKQKKVSLVIISIVLFLVIIAVGALIAIKSVGLFYVKAKQTTTQISKQRTGIEIYKSLLGKPNVDCVHIINHLDATLPIIDYTIYLEEDICASEIDRIIANNSRFKIQKRVNLDSKNPKYTTDEPGWFAINLGTNYYEACYADAETSKGETLCFNADCTKFFYCQYIN